MRSVVERRSDGVKFGPGTQGLAFALVLGTFAGCLSGGDTTGISSTSTDEPQSSVVVEPEPGVFVAENRGVLRGTVLDDAGIPVPGAHVALLRTDYAASASRDGVFLIENVTAGIHTLRAEANGFQANESEVEVRKSNVTNVDVYLVPLEDVGAGYKPHVHDFWGDQMELTIMDHDIDLTKPPGNTVSTGGAAGYIALYSVGAANTNNTAWAVPIPEGSIVVPGTKEMRVTFSWNPTQIMADKMGLSYIHAATSSRVFLPLHAAGDPWTVPVNQTMADSGHQRFSLWQLFTWTGQHPNRAPNYKPAFVYGMLHVKIVLVKGDLYLEPPHARYWDKGDQVLLRDRLPEVKDGTVCCLSRDGAHPSQVIPIPDGKLVPPGTNRLRVEFRWRYEPATGTPADFDHDLTWRTGGQSPQGTPLRDWHRATPKETGPGLKVYEFEVKPSEADAYYQKKSNWLFSPWAKPQEEDGLWLDTRDRYWSLVVIAYKDAAYAEG